MKREKWSTLIVGTVLSLLLSFACAACIATAFSLHTEELECPTVDMQNLAAWCALISFLACVCFTWRLGWLITGAIALLAFYLWYYGCLKESLEALCHTINVRYNNAYHWGLLFKESPHTDRLMALQAIGTVVALSVSWTVCRNRLSAWALVGALLPIIPCTILINTVPEEGYLLLWLLGIVLLLLTHTLRRQDRLQGNRLTLIIFLPAVLAVALLFRFTPQESYDGKERANMLLRELQGLFGVSSLPSGVGTSDVIDLTQVGSLTQRRVPRMEITVPKTDTYYLRGRAYDIYTGTNWKDSGRDYDLQWQDSTSADIGTVTIKTRYTEDNLYLPYLSSSGLLGASPREIQTAGSMLENSRELTEFSYKLYWLYSSSTIINDAENIDALTALPNSTQQWAKPFVKEIIQVISTRQDESVVEQYQLVQAIADYVSCSARYDLDTSRMGSDYSDFAQWFLNESDTGYCVHFATATTVLLRAAGIPARYVTGYMVEANAGDETTVYEKNAHAWVEYWDDGWHILEPTPAEEDRVRETSSSTTEETTQATTAAQTTTTAATEETEETTQKDTSVITSTNTTKQAEGIDLTHFLQVLKWVLYIMLPLVLIWGQWKLRVTKRKKSRRTGKANVRALNCYRQVCLYAKAQGKKPDPTLVRLAQKAKFSQHTLTREELRLFENDLDAAVSNLISAPWYRRLYHRIILALY